MNKISLKGLWKKNAFKICLGLLLICLILTPFSFAHTNSLSTGDVSNLLKVENGSTVYSGDTIIDENNINRYPVAINVQYLVDRIVNLDLLGAAYSFASGTVPMPTEDVVKGNVTDTGSVSNFDGPGYVAIENNSIVVHSPDDFVWGYNEPYTQAVKTDDGVDIVNNLTGETVKHVNENDMSNDTLPHDFSSVDQIKSWYSYAQVGAKYNLEYGIGDLSDGRAFMTPEEVKKIPAAYNYSNVHGGGDTVMIYTTPNSTYHEVTNSYTYLGSHPQYNDANRALNAKQFVKAWNNTIIPANSQGSGRSDVSFSSVVEPDAESGTATHGVCPPARTLRSTVMSIGAPLPVGMASDEDAVLFGYNPATGIKVTNPLDYPIKITMWTEGDGTDMKICCSAQELIPNNVTVNDTNSTSISVETSGD